jgi:antitoxin VapB
MKIAKLFQNGQSQAVQLPKEFKNPWAPLLDSLNKFSSDFMGTREQPKQPDREDIFSGNT